MEQNKKSFYNRGFLSLFSLFIIFMILAIGGLYMWQKYQAIKYPGGEIKDPAAYVTGIIDKVFGVQSQQKEQANRSKDLGETTKKVIDKGNLFAMDVPQSWSVAANENATGGQLSKITVQSSDFRSHDSDSGIVYDAGVRLTVTVTKGENNYFQSPNGGHGTFFVNNQEADISNLKGPLHTYKSSADPNQQLLDAHLVYGGNTYLFQFAYNSKLLRTGEAPFQFREILASVKFLRR